MWRPIMERGDGVWLGTAGDGQLWVGTRDAASSAVPLSNPVFLWPLLERPIVQVTAELSEHWPEFGLTDDVSRPGLVELLVRSAVDAARPYWVERALDWLEEMSDDLQYRHDAVVSALLVVQNNGQLPQKVRHRAGRILRVLE